MAVVVGFRCDIIGSEAWSGRGTPVLEVVENSLVSVAIDR